MPARVLSVGRVEASSEGIERKSTSLDGGTYWNELGRTVRHNYRGYHRMFWSFDADSPPTDPDQRALWILVGEGKYRGLRNMGYVYAFLGVPMFAAFTVVWLVLAVVRGGLDWVVLAAMLVFLPLSIRTARAYRRGAAELAERLKQSEGTTPAQEASANPGSS